MQAIVSAWQSHTIEQCSSFRLVTRVWLQDEGLGCGGLVCSRGAATRERAAASTNAPEAMPEGWIKADGHDEIVDCAEVSG